MMVCSYCGDEIPAPWTEHEPEVCRFLLKKLLRECRPHVAMSKSVTSGRQFQETAQVLLDKIDRVVGEEPPKTRHLRNCNGNPCECGADPRRFTHVHHGPVMANCTEPDPSDD